MIREGKKIRCVTVILPLSIFINSITIRLNCFESIETNFVLVISPKSPSSFEFDTLIEPVKSSPITIPTNQYIKLCLFLLFSLSNYMEMPLVVKDQRDDSKSNSKLS